MKIIFDRAKCKLHAQCRGAAPELFSFAPNGSLVILDENPPEELREALEDAVDACPEQAISIGE
ncbi:MAG: ferredoxin [Polyangiales bacterium]